ncbi:MAG: hypothetical protein LBQ31_09020, partial [Bacteroidales bacterium]|nr:hypothetical protein [Bacteroidales bacterium]
MFFSQQAEQKPPFRPTAPPSHLSVGEAKQNSRKRITATIPNTSHPHSPLTLARARPPLPAHPALTRRCPPTLIHPHPIRRCPPTLIHPHPPPLPTHA